MSQLLYAQIAAEAIMNRQIIKTTMLNKQDLRNIRNLIQQCRQVDGYAARAYWNILKQRQLPEYDDFICMQDGKLIAYLALYLFKEDEAEISALVHPKFRRQGLFRSLLNDALRDLNRRNISSCKLIIHKDAELPRQLMKPLKTEFDHTEIEMRLKHKIKLDNLPDIELVPADEKDLRLLAEIDSLCFNTNVDTMMMRFHQNMQAKNRRCWVAKHNGIDIGKAHVRFDDDNIAFIHDLGVRPEHRQKKYASAIVMELISILKKAGYGAIALDVLGDNTKAIKLYEKCGFEIIEHHDFYRLPVASLQKQL